MKTYLIKIATTVKSFSDRSEQLVISFDNTEVNLTLKDFSLTEYVYFPSSLVLFI